MIRLLLVFPLLMVLVFGCVNFLSSDSEEQGNEGAEAVGGEPGALEVTIRRPPGTASWDNSDVSSFATDVEVLVYNAETHATTGIVGYGTTHVISLSPGTYDVLVLAGWPETSTSTRYLLGMGEAEFVGVNSGETTEVSIGLDAFDMTTAWPTTVLQAGTDLTIYGDLVVPSDALRFPALSWHTFNVGTTEFHAVFERQGVGVWQYHFDIVVPSEPGTHECNFYGVFHRDHRLVDPEYGIDVLLEDYSDVIWRFAGVNSLEEFAPEAVLAEFTHVITVEQEPGELSVDVGWNPD